SFSWLPHLSSATLFPYTTLFRSEDARLVQGGDSPAGREQLVEGDVAGVELTGPLLHGGLVGLEHQCVDLALQLLGHLGELLLFRSEEHTSELQSRENLVCRLLLE